MTDPALLEWLLDSDAALRWQVEAYLLDAPEETWRATLHESRPRGSWPGSSPSGIPTASELGEDVVLASRRWASRPGAPLEGQIDLFASANRHRPSRRFRASPASIQAEISTQASRTPIPGWEKNR